jgi:tetratricopeptide (TPR) repeat protein
MRHAGDENCARQEFYKRPTGLCASPAGAWLPADVTPLDVTTPQIANLEKLLGTPRDGALLRLALGNAYLAAGEHERAIAQLREAVAREPQYSAAWKALGKALAEAGRASEALDAWRSGIEAAQAKGDRQAEKEMTVFARRLERKETR